MNMAESSPSFFDSQSGPSPDLSTSNTPADAAVPTPGSGTTPIRQRRLFPGSDDRENDDGEAINNNNRTLRRLNNLSVGLDLHAVAQDE